MLFPLLFAHPHTNTIVRHLPINAVIILCARLR
uniref:Uncharacterized protein n=1 Tax=Anguilla anguilla TaxID=7936 RepID=A0A0E9V0G5_ANGAN